MDNSKIYNVTLYANSSTDKIFVDNITNTLQPKHEDLNVLWYYDDSQLPLVEAPLNNWRGASADTKFTWPFVVYKFKNSLGHEICVFKEGQDSITEFANS